MRNGGRGTGNIPHSQFPVPRSPFQPRSRARKRSHLAYTTRMTNALRILFAVALLAGPARAFDVGLNQAWIGEHFGTSFSSGWDRAEVDLELSRAQAAGAKAVRLWIFEGREKD